MANTHTNDSQHNKSRRVIGRPRQTTKLVAIVVIAAIMTVWLGFWLYHRLTHVSENDATVATREITVSSRLDGRVQHFDLIQGDKLAEGEPVAALYSRPDELKRQELAARVERMQAQLDAQDSRIAQAKNKIAGGIKQTQDTLDADIAAMNAAEAQMHKAAHDAQRSQQLYVRHGVSASERDADRYAYQSAQAQYQRAKHRVAADRIALANAKTGMISVAAANIDIPEVLQKQHQVLKRQLDEAKAKLAHQDNRIADLTVAAPIAGVVDQTFIEQGEYVSAGQPIVMMHDPDNVWIEARMKETKIADLAVGQPVDIHVDAWPDLDYHGHIQVIGRAATNQFALLPDPNPSGNFTKITQRIPVRIQIDRGPKAALAPGMMVEVDVDITAHPADAGDANRPAQGS